MVPRATSIACQADCERSRHLFDVDVYIKRLVGWVMMTIRQEMFVDTVGIAILEKPKPVFVSRGVLKLTSEFGSKEDGHK